MKKMKCVFYVAMVLFFFGTNTVIASNYEYPNWGVRGFNLMNSSPSEVELVYSLKSFSLEKFQTQKGEYDMIVMPGAILPTNQGEPNLPGFGRFIAIPQGAKAKYEIVDMEMEVIHNVKILPSPEILKDTEKGEATYIEDEKIYSRNAFFPLQPVRLSNAMKIRGVDANMLSITPYQYNPVTQELKVFYNIKVKITFEGGNGHFGEDRLRNRWWDNILEEELMNYSSLPVIDYNKRVQNGSKETGCEYLIIVPNDAEFSQWADSLKLFRTTQGIDTKVVSLSEVGGNTSSAIETYIDNAYNTWDVPPAAVLLMADYGSDASNSITSPVYDSYCISDNFYADVDADGLPDITLARMTAQNATQLETMVTKVLENERTPATNPDVYDHPITACGFQTERWFQIAAETVRGYWDIELGKNTTRINAIYSGTPGSSWSTNSNTSMVVNYFGPSGLGYIPASPAALGGWTGGNATAVSNAINAGSFMLLHRDHGGEDGWGEPSYSNSDINSLNNTVLPFVWSINCLTGKFNISGECFAEKFHRHTKNGHNAGALGIIAATESSYSFVNDTYIWGCFDYMWNDFMPDFGSNPVSRGIMPAFANVAGKYFLDQSNWPSNPDKKELTNYLFHHHGDAFLSVYSEVPQTLAVTHNPVLYAGVTTFEVTANEGALIALSVDGELIGTAVGTGNPVSIDIEGQLPPTQVLVTVTLQDYYRYESLIDVIPPSGPYVVRDSYTINDAAANNNGVLDYGESVLLSLSVKNVGVEIANNVSVTLSSTDTYVTISDNNEVYGDINPDEIVTMTDAFAFSVSTDVPNGYSISFMVSATNGTDTWESFISIPANAPVLQYNDFELTDGNDNKWDAGESVNLTVSFENAGNATAFNINGLLSTTDPYITLGTASVNYGDIDSGQSAEITFTATSSATTPEGHLASFNVNIEGDYSISTNGTFGVIIGQVPVLILDQDPNTSSGPKMADALDELGIGYDYLTSFPADLNLYSSIFVCYGIYSNNHVPTNTEGQLLADYLDAGGNLYTEGGDTWAYNDPTPVTPYFHLNGDADGSNDMGTVNGIAGSFTEGMSFNYSGENSWMDHISPQGDAFLIFENETPNYGTGVAYDGGTYKTIGTSHEFGGLDDGTSPSTRTELMEAYLNFFDFVTGLQAAFSSSTTHVCTNASVDFVDLSSGGATAWSWTFEGGTPATSTEQNPNVTYTTPGTYDVELTISDGTENNTLLVEDYITVVTIPSTPGEISGMYKICPGIVSSVYTIDEVTGATSYEWTLTPENAGMISGNDTSVTIIWDEAVTGEYELTVIASNDYCSSEASTPFAIVRMNNTVELEFANPELCYDGEAFELNEGTPEGGVYSGDFVTEDAGAYYFNPAEAGMGEYVITYVNEAFCGSAMDTLTVLDQEVSLYMDTLNHIMPAFELTSYATPEGGIFEGDGVSENGGVYMLDPAVAGIGEHTLTYTYSFGSCSKSVSVDYLIEDAYGIDDNQNTYFTVYPNPTSGILRIDPVVSMGKTDIYIVNSLSEVVFEMHNVNLNETIKLDLQLAEGIYIIQLKNNNEMISKKLILK
jgi:PKD repeat protein